MNQENIYLQRINLVINHIQGHLSDPLPLHALARVASFSPFHFHRIFKSLVDETLNQYVLRLRLERAASLLKAAPDRAVADVAYECGFESPSHFSRAFKAHFGISPRQWDRHSPLKNSKNGQVLEGFPRYTLDNLREAQQTGEFEVRLRQLPAQRLAYIRVWNSYQSGGMILSAYQRLIDWFERRGGEWAETTLYGMSQDDPDVTPLERCRFDWCLRVPDGWTGEDEISVIDFPACHIAYVRCEGDIFVEDRAWQYLFNYWLPRSRFQPDNLPAMEIYRQQPAEIGWERYNLDCAIPVVAL